MEPDFQSETGRIREEYLRREREIPEDFYALTKPANLFMHQSRERAFIRLLAKESRPPLAEQRILEIGCGQGNWLAMFEAFGAQRENLAGIELDEGRYEFVRQRLPGADLRLGNAARLPWPDASFQLVLQSTVFTSILDRDLQRQVAAEMLRVLAPGGRILWYDFRYDNPRNPNVRGVRRREIAALFPGCRLDLRKITLAPPLARQIVPVWWGLAAFLEKLRLLNTHYFGTIQPVGR